MSSKSYVYKHIYLYRILMTLIYAGGYKKRFSSVLASLRSLPPSRVIVELCFGDIVIAEYCKKAGHQWVGLDINEAFVAFAKRKGYDAKYCDLVAVETLPTADVMVMMGSFYHFHGAAETILSRMLKSAPTVYISEPVVNLSNRNDWVGKIARRAANAGKGHEEFRYTRETFLQFLKTHSQRLNYSIAIIEENRRDLVIKLIKNERR